MKDNANSLLRTSVILLIILCQAGFIHAQEPKRDFSAILQTYYLYHDPDIVAKAIEFGNNPQVSYKRLEPVFTGFFGALFSVDTVVRNRFVKNLDSIHSSEFKQLFSLLAVTDIDAIYSKTPFSPSYNDMNWSSYFATGDLKYLDRIIANIPLAGNRVDRNLFLTGASAKWSLCSNAGQDEKVKAHLVKLQDSNRAIREILEKDPQVLKQEMKDVIAEQRAKGLWN